jgi:hypothetical protein
MSCRAEGAVLWSKCCETVFINASWMSARKESFSSDNRRQTRTISPAYLEPKPIRLNGLQIRKKTYFGFQRSGLFLRRAGGFIWILEVLQ